jgi:hypothetical protein
MHPTFFPYETARRCTLSNGCSLRQPAETYRGARATGAAANDDVVVVLVVRLLNGRHIGGGGGC